MTFLLLFFPSRLSSFLRHCYIRDMIGSPARPHVAICCCLRDVANGAAHAVRERYVEALLEGAGTMPLLVPAVPGKVDAKALFERVDGLVLTGSPSNVDPAHYGGGAALDPHLADAARDGTTLPLIRAAVAMGVPVFGICRGIQEVNVALGGSLHQRLHELDGHFDHRSDKTVPSAERFCDAHDIRLRAGGLLQRIVGGAERARINSLHAQGIDRLADPLVIEAQADDGTIEAVSLRNPGGFLLAIQWHPEYNVCENLLNLSIYRAFGEACRAFAAKRASTATGCV